jgi:choline kinase
MRIIVLAAGRGERLLPLTKDRPKSLIDLGGGKTVLGIQLEQMRASRAITEAVFVVGYRASQIEAVLAGETDSRLTTRSLHNPFYAVSNNLASLWLARGEMDRDFLVTNGDCIFPSQVYAQMVQEGAAGVHLAVTYKDAYDDDDMKVCLEGRSVLEVSKRLAPSRALAESPGLALVRGADARRRFVTVIESLLRNEAALDNFWLEVFNALSRASEPVVAWPLPAGTRWQEIDFHPDLNTARSMLKFKLG